MGNKNRRPEVRLCIRTVLYAACRTFYEKVLGLKIFSEWDRESLDRGVVYEIEGSLLELLESKKENATTLDGSFYLYIEVPDVERYRVELEAKGVRTSPLVTTAWHHKSFDIADPAGMKLTFFTKMA